MKNHSDTAAIVLAAGLGKRIGVDIPKVMLAWHGRPLIRYVTDALAEAGIGRVILVIGHQGELVEKEYQGEPVEFVWQHERLGTAHAVWQAESVLQDHSGPIFVLLGDAPRVKGSTIRNLLARHEKRGAAATILTAEISDPTGYGRVVTDTEGMVDRIVEHRDADEATRSIREINSGAICFDSKGLFELLHHIGNDNNQHEFYLTDAIGLLRAEGRTVIAHRADDPREVLGVNTLDEFEALG